MRDERHVEGLRLPKKRGLHSSHSQPQPKLRRPRHRWAHTTHWKYMMGSQTKYASYRDIEISLRKLPTGMIVASALWRRSFWKHNQAYRRLIWRMQRCVNWFVPRTTVCTVRDLIVTSWRKETKYTASTHVKELEEGNQEEENDQRHDVGICTDFIFLRFNLNEIQLYSLTRSTHYS